MRIIIAILISLSMIFGASVKENYNAYSNIYCENSGCIIGELQFNYEIMHDVFGDNTNDEFGSNSTIYLCVSPDKDNVDFRLYVDESIIRETTLKGTYNTIDSNNVSGYVAVYEGFISPIPNHQFGLTQDEMLPIIADVTFSDNDMFAVLTIGYATEQYNPYVFYYGDFTDSIKLISEENAKSKLTESRIRQLQDIAESEEQSEEDPLRIDATCKYKGTTAAYMGSHKAGVLSVFHADEMINTGVMSTYVKVNTKSANVQDYLEDDLGFGSSIVTVYPDTFNISINGNHNNMHAVTNSYLPQNNSTSATIDIPVYAPIIGLQFVSYNIIMSSTTVTPSKYSNSSPHPNNILTWNIYRQNGWNPWDYDGSHSTSTGMTVQATYTYAGNVLGVITRSLTSTGSIRYEYLHEINGSYQTLHISTSTMNLLTTLLMYP